ncbi:hypothetical protein DFH27DRAFT_615791 [Peziza echinospora]|nr:hypothetical protein DFH27DRAFT_615791 [Peziza echinospora]
MTECTGARDADRRDAQTEAPPMTNHAASPSSPCRPRLSSPSPQPSSPFSQPSTPTPISTSSGTRRSSSAATSTTPHHSDQKHASRQPKPHQAHVRAFFSARTPSEWNLPAFDIHCRKYRGDEGSEYLWTIDKIHSFWLDHLNALLKESPSLAAVGKIKREIRRAKGKHATGEKKEKKRSKAAPAPPITFVQGSVGTFVSGNTKCEVNVESVSASSTSVPRPEPIDSGSTPGESNSALHPSTPPPRAANNDSDGFILGTPPAPPPDRPSYVKFKSGIPIDLWFRKLRSRLSLQNSQNKLKFPYLLDSNILDVDDEAIREYSFRYPNTLEEITQILAQNLPATDKCVEYANNRFTACARGGGGAGAYRELTESSPRPPGVPWSRENNSATYINQAVGHLLTVMDKLGESNVALTPYLREGFFDSSINPWFIDALFLGGRYPNLFLSRKEIQSYIPGCAEKFDAVVRYADGLMAFDVGVMEVSGGAANINNDVKSERDFAKAHRALSGNLQILTGLVGKEWDVMQKLQVVGIINNGWNVTILRMGWVTPQVMVMKTHRTIRIPLVVGQLGTVFPLMELMVKCHRAMEETVKVVLEYQMGLPL